MKKLVFLALALCSALSFAGEITVVESSIRPVQFRPVVDARFQMNQSTGEGFVRVTVTEERMTYGGYYDHMGRYYPQSYPTLFLVHEETVRVPQLELVDHKVIFHGEEGDVECGTMGVSRVLKKPTIYLSGNCKLDGYLTGFRYAEKVVVKLKTK